MGVPVAVALLAACGGGGGGSTSASPPGMPAPPPPAANRVLWLSGAGQTTLYGDADSGLPGPLFAVDPARPSVPAGLSPAVADSSTVRIAGGRVDATLATLSDAGPQVVVFDAPSGGGGAHSFSLFRLPLNVDASATPSVVRLSSETAICSTIGPRFSVIGQSLSGDDAVIVYAAPDALGSCAAGGVPRMVALDMDPAASPIALPDAPAERLRPIGPIHASNGSIAALLAWRDGRFVRTDARLGNPVVIPASAIGGAPTVVPEPTGPGIVTRFGIFLRSSEGLRRYDKSTGRISEVLIAGSVGVGALFNDLHDDQALYITAVSGSGQLDLYRVTDTLAPAAQRLNVEGPLSPYGFRVLRDHVLYALDLPGSIDYVAWRKADGQRSSVLAGKNVLVSSTLHDRVVHESTSAGGARVLASSRFDGSDERSYGDAQIVSRAIGSLVSPFARHVRDNGAFSHVLVVIPAAGAAGLTGARALWISLDPAAVEAEAGGLPSMVDLGSSVEGPGISGAASLFAVARAGGTGTTYFVARRADGVVTQVNR